MPREFLGANSQEGDVVLQNKMNSVFWGKRPTLYENIHMERKDVLPTPSATYGASMDFQPDRTMDLLGPVTLCLTASAVTSAGAGAGYPRWPDYWPYHLISEVRVTWTSNHLQTLTGLQMYIIHATSRLTDDSLEEAVYGGLSAGQRAINATAESTAYLPLPLFWTTLPQNYLPYNIRVLRANLRITVTLRSLVDVIETDGATPSGTISAVLRCQAFYLQKHAVNQIKAEISQMNAPLRSTGYARLVTTYEGQQSTIANSTAEQTIVVSQMRRPTKEVMFVVRQDSDIATGTATARDIFGFQKMEYQFMNALGRTLTPKMEERYNKHIHNNQYHNSDPAENIYGNSFSMAPQADSTVIGYLNFSAITNPEQVVKMPSTWATTGKIDFVLPTYNVYTITPTADLKMMFA